VLIDADEEGGGGGEGGEGGGGEGSILAVFSYKTVVLSVKTAPRAKKEAMKRYSIRGRTETSGSVVVIASSELTVVCVIDR